MENQENGKINNMENDEKLSKRQKRKLRKSEKKAARGEQKAKSDFSAQEKQSQASDTVQEQQSKTSATVQEKQPKPKKTRANRGTYHEIRWEQLDNTAHLFPVIAGENATNVYRISVTLTETVQPGLLQEALDFVLPKFDGFNLRLRQGVFWYYFEENGKPAPRVREENTFPCRFVRANKNNSYLFRVTYYKRRINLEAFHVLTDGMGGINFLRELAYQYLRMAHPELRGEAGDALNSQTSMNREDSFLKNYRHKAARGYQSKRAYLIKGEKLPTGEFGVMHGYMKISQLKEACHRYDASINEYLVSVYAYSVYAECMHGMSDEHPIRVAVPVNLRPYFHSITTKNFFVMVSAEYAPAGEGETFEAALAAVKESLRTQIKRENLENLFSYNVASEKLWIARAAPLFMKNIAMRSVYSKSALANTATVTNIGNIAVAEPYKQYIEMFYAFLALSKGQHLKGTICSYGDTLVFSFSYDLVDVSVQRGFFRQLAADGVDVRIETNGASYE